MPLRPGGAQPDTTVHELWLTSELLVGGCLFIVIFLLGVVFIRRRLIARGKPLTVCALRESGDGPWRLGLVRYGATGLEGSRSPGSPCGRPGGGSAHCSSSVPVGPLKPANGLRS